MGNYGALALFGSGETSSQGRKIHDYLMSNLTSAPPVRVALLETPAGFQPNVDFVYSKIADFFEKSLQNFRPQVEYIRAWKRGAVQDPDSHDVVKALLDAQYIFSGPGSPTYAARNLRGTRALRYTIGRYKEGASIVLSSAAALAAGRYAMRVYEILKAGDDLGWDPGLSLLSELGLGVDPVIVPHWNNKEGGDGLDTNRCYVGKDRFAQLLEMLPEGVPVLGIDEHTACLLLPGSNAFKVMGAGEATVINGGETVTIQTGDSFPLALLAGGVAVKRP